MGSDEALGDWASGVRGEGCRLSSADLFREERRRMGEGKGGRTGEGSPPATGGVTGDVGFSPRAGERAGDVGPLPRAQGSSGTVEENFARIRAGLLKGDHNRLHGSPPGAGARTGGAGPSCSTGERAGAAAMGGALAGRNSLLQRNGLGPPPRAGGSMQSNPTRKDRGCDRNRDPNQTRANRKEFSRGSQGRAPGVPVDPRREEQEEGGGGDGVRTQVYKTTVS